MGLAAPVPLPKPLTELLVTGQIRCIAQGMLLGLLGCRPVEMLTRHHVLQNPDLSVCCLLHQCS